jgi:fructose-bisphosphate aldolase, class II
MQTKTIEILKKAMEEREAVGAFNTSNLEISQAIIRAAKKVDHPCIIQVTASSINYVGDKIMKDMLDSVIKNESNSTPIGFHLDHGHSLDDIMRAIDIGVDSVMIDASTSNFKENLATTKKIVDYAHSKDVSVQAELGKVPYLGREEAEVNWEEIMTIPEEAKKLVEETEIDALAVSIGNAHGFFREKEEPDWERLHKIKEFLPDTPLILHGGSDWRGEKVKKAVEGGICCFNIDTDLRLAFSTAMCKVLGERCEVHDPRKILGEAREAVQKKVEEKIKLFAG